MEADASTETVKSSLMSWWQWASLVPVAAYLLSWFLLSGIAVWWWVAGGVLCGAVLVLVSSSLRPGRVEQWAAALGAWLAVMALLFPLFWSVVDNLGPGGPAPYPCEGLGRSDCR